MSFFDDLNKACEFFGIQYFVVGAFARDILLEVIFKQPSGIATKDIDVAVKLDSWDDYNNLINYLIINDSYKKGTKPHEFITPDNLYIDIIPFGNIESERSISFPPNFSHIVNMLGFREVLKFALELSLDKKIQIRIASIESIVLLKFIAWNDREPSPSSEKHSRDIGLIINIYYDSLVHEFAVEFSDLFDDKDFDPLTAGAKALGRRLKQICTGAEKLTDQLGQIFSKITNEKDSTLFVTQLTTASHRSYDKNLEILKSLEKGFLEF